MIAWKLLSHHLPKFAFVKMGNGLSETEVRHPWGTGSVEDYSRPRRRTATTSPEDKNLMGLLMTRVG